MLLAVDVGNSNVKFALFDGDKMIDRWHIKSDDTRDADQYAKWLEPLLTYIEHDFDDIDAMIISTVVPKILSHLQLLGREYCNVAPFVANHQSIEWGVDINVDIPALVGSDRIVNAIAAHEKYQEDLIVISLGTATTIDYVGKNGDYNGGLIAPGMALSRDALANAAAQLPYIELKKPDDKLLIGKNTDQQILAGMYWGYHSLLSGLIERMKCEINSSVKVIGTGGLSVLFDEGDVFDHIDAELTLRGLAILFHRQG